MLHIVGVQSSGKSQVIVMFLLRHNREELQPLGQCSQGGAAGGRLVPGVSSVPTLSFLHFSDLILSSCQSWPLI